MSAPSWTAREPASVQGPYRIYLETQASSQKAQAWSLRRSNYLLWQKSKATTAWEPVFKASDFPDPAASHTAVSRELPADCLRAGLEFGDSEAGPETQAEGTAGV